MTHNFQKSCCPECLWHTYWWFSDNGFISVGLHCMCLHTVTATHQITTPLPFLVSGNHVLYRQSLSCLSAALHDNRPNQCGLTHHAEKNLFTKPETRTRASSGCDTGTFLSQPRLTVGSGENTGIKCLKWAKSNKMCPVRKIYSFQTLSSPQAGQEDSINEQMDDHRFLKVMDLEI